MLAVLLEVRPLPHQTITPRRHPVRPDVRAPQHDWRQLLRNAQRARLRIHRTTPHLVYLGLDRPLNRESPLVWVGLRIPPRIRIAAVASASQKNELQIRIPNPERAHNRAEIGEESV